MSHCPQCGRPTPFEGAVACPFCGASLGAAAPAAAPKAAARTMLGVSVSDLPIPSAAAPAPAAGAPPAKANRTIVGMPASAVGPHAGPPAGQPKIPSQVNRTIVGMTQPLGTNARPRGDLQPAPPPDPAGRTLLGVARPGIAPLAPGVATDDDGDGFDGDPAPPHHGAMGELGATMGPAGGAAWSPQQRQQAPISDRPGRNDPRRRRHLPAADNYVPPKAKEAISKRALAVVLAAGGLALVAVLFALFWPSAPPLTARARADAEGREGVELNCSSCPDGTKVSIGEASATMANGTALVPLPTALSLGENRMKVAVDRPGNGRDETVAVALNVAYRIRPDLTTLQGDRPSIQIIAEAAKGTTIAIDGRSVPIAGGRAVETVDVTDACTGMSSEPKSLTRQIPYTVTPDSGPVEKGTVNVSVGIVPLQIDAPGSHITIDGSSFILAGRTMKGAEVLAAGRQITVRPDGTFAQQMNVSSIGATQIEVRARLAGLAPRLVQMKVRRVDNLETAAREFASESPITYAPLAQNISGQVGKAIALSGEVVESRVQGYQTMTLLDASRASGCQAPGTCTVRLVQGAKNEAKKGDVIRVFGHVSRSFAVPGRADIPEIEVDFTLKGQK